MVTPRTGRPRGRPRGRLLTDPERFAVPFVDALLVLSVSETDAFKIAALQLIGTTVAVRTVGPRRKRGRGAVPGGTLVSYADDARIEGRATTLRRKFKNPMTAEIARWRMVMGRAFLLTLTGKNSVLAGAKIRELAVSVGEERYADTCLLPLLKAKFSRLPDYLTDVLAEYFVRHK
jgi:hypothetical protein